MLFVCKDYISFIFTTDIDHKLIRMVREDKTQTNKERGLKLWKALDKIIKEHPEFGDYLSAEGISLDIKIKN